MRHTIETVVGYTLLIVGLSLHLPLIVALQEQSNISTFLWTMVFSLSVGSTLYHRNKNHKFNSNDTRCLCIATVTAWGVAIVVAAAPLLPHLLSSNTPIIDALFESTSGLTTTGSTIISDLDNTPRSILAWRAMMQFVGGIGFIMIVVALTPTPSTVPIDFLRTEYSDKNAKTLPKTSDIAIRIVGFYSFLGCVVALGYYTCGLTFFESLCHAMSTVST